MAIVIRYLLHCGLIRNVQLYYITLTLFTHGINVSHKFLRQSHDCR